MIIDVPRGWLRRHRRVADGLLALAVLLLTLLLPEPDPDRVVSTPAVSWTALLLGVVACAPLVVRRERPLPVLVVTVLGTLASSVVVGDRTLLVQAPMIALYTVAVRGDRRTTWLAWVGTMVTLVIGGGLSRTGPGWDPELVSYVAWTGFAAGVGDALGNRRAYVAAVEERAVRAERDREQESLRRVTEERLRIARDLHDVVAHHIAVVTVQAGVAAYLLPDQPVAAQEALGHVRRAAATVLDELGGILSVLRQADDPVGPTAPAPGLDQLESLIGSFATAGLAVDWSVSGQPRPLVAGVDLVAYRILQEALTNAHKHGAGTATLSVAYRPTALELRVGNPVGVPELVAAARGPLASGPVASGPVASGPVASGPGASGPGADDRVGSRPVAAGHGLLGMQERASAVGGSIRVVSTPDGQFALEAVLPLPPASGRPAT